MASVVYNRFLQDLGTAAANLTTSTFYASLVTSTYTANKDSHTVWSDVTNETTGTGYTAGGKVVSATCALSTANDQYTITFGDVTWNNAVLTARAAVVRRSLGGTSASNDPLVAYVDFGSNVTSTDTSQNFIVSFTTSLRLTNP